MPTDDRLIKLSDAKAAMTDLITECTSHLRAHTAAEAFDEFMVSLDSALDSLPAAEGAAGERWHLAWRELFNWLWDSDVKGAGKVIDYMNRLEVTRDLPVDADLTSRPEAAQREEDGRGND